MLPAVPAEHGPSDVGFAGPGHHVAVLESGHGSPDGAPAGRSPAGERCEKDSEAVYEVPASRWGDAPRNLRVLPRTAEEVPEPWAWLAAHADVARPGEVQGPGRRVAVAVAGRDGADAVRLPAVVTETAPP